MTDINDFKNSIATEFDIFNGINASNKLLTALYSRYKKCIESGNDDCIDVAIGTIRDFFDNVRSQIDEELTDEEIFDMYEDYFEEQNNLEFDDVKWGEYLDDLGQSEMDRFVNQQDEEVEDVQIEAPTEVEEAEEEIEPEEEEEEEVAEIGFQNPIGNISNNVSVPGSDYKYEGSLFTNYDGNDLLIDSYQLAKLYPELYESMYKSGEWQSYGTTTNQIDYGITYTPNFGISDDDASNFLIAYYDYVLNAYSKTGSIIVSEDGQQSILWSEDEDTQGILTLLYSYYETGNINAIDELITMEAYADVFLQAVQDLDADNGYTETENFYESMAYLIDTMGNTYEDYSYSDVYSYMKDNTETFSTGDYEDTITSDSILQFYQDNGYVYDEEEDKLYTEDEYNELIEEQFVEQELDEFESPIGNISNIVSMPGTSYKYEGPLFTSYDGNELIIDAYQLAKLYPDLYEATLEANEITGTTEHSLIDEYASTYPNNMGLTGDEASDFLLAYYYYILEEYSKTGAIVVSETGDQSVLWSEDETTQGALALLWEYYTNDTMPAETLQDIINGEFANTILEYVTALDSDYSYTEQFYENIAYLVYETSAVTDDINYSDIYSYMADNYDELNQDSITQESVYDYFVEEKGYTYNEDTETLEKDDVKDGTDADKDTSDRLLQEDDEEIEDTPKTDSLVDGYYYTQDSDGTYRVYQVSNGQLNGTDETYDNDDFLKMFGGDKDVDFYEMTPEILEQVEDFGDVDKETITSEVTDKYAEDTTETAQVGDHIRDVNNTINNMQITENMGDIKLNSREPTSKNLISTSGRKTIMGVNYDGSSRIEHIPNDEVTDYTTEGGNNIMRLDGTNRKLTREEWKIIENSYLYDKDITKPFIIDKMEDPSQYKVNYNNVFEYYFELSNKNTNFFVWLDSYKGGEEGRSYVNYKVSSNIQSNNLDINNYVKTGSILDLLPSIEFTPHFNNQGSQAQEKAIIETHALGIEDVNAFILVASLSSLFCNLIMENAKHIGKNSIVQNIESNIKKGDFEGLKDNVYAGLYQNGSQLQKSIDNAELTDAQKTVLKAIFSERSFKSIGDYEVNNRYGEIVLKFYGTNDERKHKLENNTGKILFELGLVLLSYYASMMDNNELLGIDTNEKSNLIKITSEFLETLYPSKKYDKQLITGIDNIIKLMTREIRNLKRGNVANEISAEDLLRDVVRDILNISMNETPTTFNVYDFFSETLVGHISNNFGLDMYVGISDYDSMIEFIIEGFLDSQQFNQMVQYVMTSTMGENFNFKGNDMLEVLFMSKIQAQTFINNPKYNLLVPLIHPEIIDLVPPEKVNINLWGFNAKIIGLVQYDKHMPIYDTAIQDDVNRKTTLYEDEPNFMTKEDAETRGELMDIEGTHQHDDGTFMVGDSHEVLEKYYEDLAVNQDDFSNAMFNLTKTKESDMPKIAKEELRIMVEDAEDIKTLPESYEMGDVSDDWKLAGLLEILNKNPEDLESELQKVITDFKDVEIIKPTEGDNYVMIKHGDKLYVAFRGSKGFFEYQDWYGETGNFRNMDTNSFYSMTRLGLGQNHQGFKKGYEKMRDGLIDALNDNLDSNTQLYITGHSRGTAFADMLVEDAIRLHPKDKITYRGFGYITHRNKENAEQMNNKIKGMDYMTYHISGDPLRLLTKVLPYYPVGDNKIITGYENAFTGSLFYGADINSLAEVREDDTGAMSTAYEDFWKIARTPIASQHFITGYKSLLAQDKHIFKFRKKAESTYNTPMNYAVGATMLYGGWKAYKLLTETKTNQRYTSALEKETTFLEEKNIDIEAQLLDTMLVDEHVAELERVNVEHKEEINYLQRIIDSNGESQYINQMEGINQAPLELESIRVDPSVPESPRMPELDISPIKAVSEDIPPRMGLLDEDDSEWSSRMEDLGFRRGGKVVKSKMNCNNPKKSTREGKRKMVKACEGGTEKLIHYGDSNLGAHPENPKRKKSFRARHKCDTNPPDKLSARYWSCKDW